MTPRRALVTLVLASGLLRLICAAGLGPGNDEAYHYLFTLHPALSYYDHPPMLALVEGVGLMLSGRSASPLGLRLGFVLLFVGSTLLMARLAGRFFGAWAGVVAATLLNVSGYFGLAAGLFALPDGPLVFFWLLTLDRLAVALGDERGRTRLWLAVGLAWGGAMLSKYHAVFLPTGAVVYILMEPRARAWLRRPGPYMAALLGLAVFSPVLVWNSEHGWASFAFQGGRAVKEVAFRPLGLVIAVLGQAGYLFPWVWVPLVIVGWREVRRGLRERWYAPPPTPSYQGGEPARKDRNAPPPTSPYQGGEPESAPSPGKGGGSASRYGALDPRVFLLSQALLPFAVFLALACVRPVLPHWSLVGYLPLMPLVGRAWVDEVEGHRLRRRLAVFAVFPLAVVAVSVVQVQFGVFQKGSPTGLGWLPVSRDPSVDLYGWDQVAGELRRRGLLGRPGTFLFTSKWFHSGQLGFALGGEAPVLCYSGYDPHGFAFWSRPEDWVGRDGILLVVNHSSAEPAAFERWFAKIEPLGQFAVQRAGVPVRMVRLYRCVRQTRPFPFDAEARLRVASATRFGDNRHR
jgi:4-amino-4-deoxy-L-arabinose transferase-like glycosyltransferase